MTRLDRPEGRPTGSVGTHRKGTPEGYVCEVPTGTVLRLTRDLEAVGADLLERLGPRDTYRLADVMIRLADSLRPARRVDPARIRRNAEQARAIRAELLERTRCAPPPMPPRPSREVAP